MPFSVWIARAILRSRRRIASAIAVFSISGVRTGWWSCSIVGSSRASASMLLMSFFLFYVGDDHAEGFFP
ncbi:hypothetical protein ASE82_14740 [Sphingomonas sp. Leaf230]|nr:hypothetical protein ASE82_14740 [Sphingomonas sp. Leaf230]